METNLKPIRMVVYRFIVVFELFELIVLAELVIALLWPLDELFQLIFVLTIVLFLPVDVPFLPIIELSSCFFHCYNTLFPPLITLPR